MAVAFTYLCPLLNAFHTKYVWTWFDFSITTLVSNKIQANKAINIVHIAQVRKLILRTNLWSQLSTQIRRRNVSRASTTTAKFFVRAGNFDRLFICLIGCLMTCTQSLAIYVFGGERGIGWDALGVSWEGTKEKYRSGRKPIVMRFHREEARAILEHIYHYSVVKVEIQVIMPSYIDLVDPTFL